MDGERTDAVRRCPTQPADNANDISLGGSTSASSCAFRMKAARMYPRARTVNYQTDPPASGRIGPRRPSRVFMQLQCRRSVGWHNLEHGHVVVLYDCGGRRCAGNVLTGLEVLAANHPKLVATPYAGLPEPAVITAIAWDVEMHFASFDAQALASFYERHVDQGPERCAVTAREVGTWEGEARLTWHRRRASQPAFECGRYSLPVDTLLLPVESRWAAYAIRALGGCGFGSCG